MSKTVYRILSKEEFEEFQSRGSFEGSEKDRAAGFIHLSTRDQVPKTARKYREKFAELRLIAIDMVAVEHHVRWERGRDGEIYPHLFAPITRSIAKTDDLSLLDES